MAVVVMVKIGGLIDNLVVLLLFLFAWWWWWWQVNQGWLEPLMARIAEDRHHVVMPVIDSIDADSMKYRKGGIDILGFSWTLGQAPINRRRSAVDPMPSPIMAGGLFSIDRIGFYELGTCVDVVVVVARVIAVPRCMRARFHVRCQVCG